MLRAFLLLSLAVAITLGNTVMVQWWTNSGNCGGSEMQSYSLPSGQCQTYADDFSLRISCDSSTFTFQIYENASCNAAYSVGDYSGPLQDGCISPSNETDISFILTCGSAGALQSWANVLLEWFYTF